MKNIINTLIAFDSKYNMPLIAGCDEAGRGCLAGPVVAACVGLTVPIEGINDSKKLSAKSREILCAEILAKAWYVKAAMASVEEIELLGIRGATLLAMERAAQDLKCELLLVDGDAKPATQTTVELVPHGDTLSYQIAAASIVAKVTRDAYMMGIDADYPEYGFAQHKGYGTAAHYSAIILYGATDQHRKHFLRTLNENHRYAK